MPPTAALYLRSSKDRSDVSIDAQRRELFALAHDKKLSIVAEYVDAVESAKTDQRPGFQSLLRDLKSADRPWSQRRSGVTNQTNQTEDKKMRYYEIFKPLVDGSLARGLLNIEHQDTFLKEDIIKRRQIFISITPQPPVFFIGKVHIGELPPSLDAYERREKEREDFAKVFFFYIEFDDIYQRMLESGCHDVSIEPFNLDTKDDEAKAATLRKLKETADLLKRKVSSRF